MYIKTTLGIVGAMLIALVYAMHVSHPHIKLPDITGDFNVGTTYLHLIDNSRKELHNETANRELFVQVYYPIDRTNLNNFEKYLKLNFEYVKKSIAEMKNISIDTLDYVNNLKTHSILNANISDQASTYPVVLFSPGFGSPQDTYTSYLEDLASHGYIVLGTNHPYVTDPTVFLDGRIILQDRVFKSLDSEKKKEIELNTWIEDIKFLVTELKNINLENKILKSKINLQQIGIMGHSFGGRMAIQAARWDNRIKAGVDLDGKLTSDIPLSGFDTPFMFIVAQRKDTTDQDRIEQLQKNMTKDAYLIVIKNSDHGTFTDLNLVFKPWLYQGNIDPQRGIEIIRKYIYIFFDKYLKNESNNLLKDINRFNA
ncbi:MAG TPA: alpha/beta hydrolase [Aquella sp.]|jgi:dienelactone hydrolase|nr:alpha/beta hydrolase [Aquella sp.]